LLSPMADALLTVMPYPPVAFCMNAGISRQTP
jgi:hypothetical protein